MAAFVRFSIPHRYIGASTDTKPATAEVGSLCYEHNTGKTFVTYNGADWAEYAPTTYLNDISAETLTLSGGAGALTFSAAATIVAASGLTMPAFTLGGAVTGNAQTISNANVTVGASRTLDVSAGTLTLAADQISGDKVEGGTVNAITINTLTLGTGLTGADKPFTGLGDFTYTDGSIIATATSDSATLIFKATDDDGAALAQLEVMRLVGANDPYVAFGGSQQNIFYNSGAITIGGNVTFGAGLAIASGAVNGNTLLIRANDTTFLTLTTGATDTLDIGAHNISGDVTVTSTKGIAFDTYDYKISDGGFYAGDGATAYDLRILRSAATGFAITALDGTTRKGLYAGVISTDTGFYFEADVAINGRNADGGYFTLAVRDSTVGRVEIARAAGAADPYFRVGRDDTGVALNAVTDGLYLMMAGGTGNSASGQGFGMPWYLGNAASETEERASIDCVLVTATNGAEDAVFKFNVMGAGAMVEAFTLSSSTATFNTDVVMGTQVIDADSGAVTFVDMSVTDAPADGTEESLDFKLDGVSMWTLYGKADSAGAVDERALHCGAYLKLYSTDTDSAVEGHVWYDASTHTIVFHNGTAVKTLAVTA
jgi:hypothetical protein